MLFDLVVCSVNAPPSTGIPETQQWNEAIEIMKGYCQTDLLYAVCQGTDKTMFDGDDGMSACVSVFLREKPS